jgi:hypothetical protein
MKRQVSGEKIADLLASTALVACLLAIGFDAGKANAEETTGRVSLTARLNNAPAFQSVQWLVMNNAGLIVAETKRHSATFQLPPANYTAKLLCPNGSERGREFTVGSNRTITIAVACD